MVEREEKAFRAWVAFRSPSLALLAVFTGILIMPVILIVSPAPWVAVAVIVGFVLETLALVAASMAHVTVGSDGVLVRRLGERRYLRFAEVLRVAEVDGETLRFSLRHGGRYDLYTHKDQNVGKIGYEDLCNELYARCRAGVAAARGHGDEERAEAIVERADPARRDGYRIAAAASEEELWSVVSDAAASAELRARAAASLRRDPARRAKLLRIAEDTAAPALARALRVAAGDDEAEVEAAIAEVEAEAHARRRHPGA